MKFIGSFLIFLLWLISAVANAQTITLSFESLDSLQQTDPRPVVVFIHTDWCRFCSAMKTSFADEAVIEILNEYFYFVDFDAESSAPIVFNRRIFNYKPTGATTGIHELAE